ncbi:hypothetical protein JXJ21_01490, partial [candidate division KSB1 bacterium]|nr:hypothetical protein [candidate division KSB1 bacterium]
CIIGYGLRHLLPPRCISIGSGAVQANVSDGCNSHCSCTAVCGMNGVNISQYTRLFIIVK